MLYNASSIYKSLIEDKKVTDIIYELNCHAHRVTEKFKQLVDALFAFEEVDNEINRVSGRYKLDGSYYISALLFYVATKGWKEPIQYLINNGADIRLIVLYDDYCTRDKLNENVAHFFDIKVFLKF
uniref:Ankyrin repeat protein n=1 Tax=viral metagenome TaxID=1070528 RepID=A0A6C0KRB7_9ZZZZ